MEAKSKEVIVTDTSQTNKNSVHNTNINFNSMIGISQKFAAINKLILRDLNGSQSTSSFSLFNKDNITNFLQNPQSNEKNIRDAITYIYGASSHFRRLIQYFTSLTSLAYVVSPYKIDTATAKPKTLKKNYTKTTNLIASMDIKNQFPKIVTVCLREDVFYATMWVTTESVIIQQLPSDYCSIAVIEDNVLNVSFNFAYFDTNSKYLDKYPLEFQKKYKLYQNDRTGKQWQELDSPTSFAIKCNTDILSYALPPFMGILREIYDLEDYKQLKLSKTTLENYAMLVMKLGINEDGEWSMPLEVAKEFWRNLDGVLPEEVGSVLSPMQIEKISFDRNNAGDTNTISEAEQNLFTAAGVSSLLFNNEKASANALATSIKADQALTFGIVKSIESALNRFIHAQSYGKNFKVTFLNCSEYNRKELGDAYIKACTYGMPMVSYYCASQGLSQDEMDYMNFLEDDVLDIKRRFKPLQNSATQSGDSNIDNEVGRPTKDADELTEAGEQTREDE